MVNGKVGRVILRCAQNDKAREMAATKCSAQMMILNVEKNDKGRGAAVLWWGRWSGQWGVCGERQNVRRAGSSGDWR